jgi:hypothetical protein
MDVHRTEHVRAGVDEGVGNLSGRDDDVTGLRVDRVIADGECRLTFLDDERLRVGVAVQAGTFARLRAGQEEETGAAWAAPSKR